VGLVAPVRLLDQVAILGLYVIGPYLDRVVDVLVSAGGGAGRNFSPVGVTE
jgi:hypothetical protein